MICRRSSPQAHACGNAGLGIARIGEAIETLRRGGADLVVMLYGAFTGDDVSAAVADALNVPLILWAPREPELNGGRLLANAMVALTMNSASLYRLGHVSHPVYGGLESAEATARISTLIQAYGVIKAMRHTLIHPILIGDRHKIAAAAHELGEDIAGCSVIHVETHRDAAAMGVKLVNEGRAKALMKGYLHTDELLGQVVKSDGGLRIGRRLSHVFVFDVPGQKHLIFVTDAAINIAPDLETKVDIVQNAIDLARTLGIETPKVGVLSAVETVNPKIPSTLDAAALSKMAERGQIRNGLVDGPLAMDNAIDMNAARTKGIKSLVAGQADILVAPNLESGNMLAKELTFVAHAEAGGVVIGAKCPIILTSRSDDDKARLASCAIAALYAERKDR